MPVRKEKQVVEKVAPVVIPEVQKEEIADSVATHNATPEKWTLEELDLLDTKELEKMVIEQLDIDPRADGTKSTRKKLRTIILDEQKKGNFCIKSANILAAPAVSIAAVKQVGSVYFEAGLTINTGNYENVKVTIGMTLPVNPTLTDISEAQRTLQMTKELVVEELHKNAEEIKGK